jgi:mRNA-degrading endonuclease RelE of RelBE toxin-antitoxin system|tara:strand:- start:213 stop:464 length:252 start_codon:yes stop_codon:yes gene_type:complete
MYSVDIRNTSKKFLKKLPKKESDIILNKIYSLRQNPFRFLKRLKGNKLWRLRVLKYRVIMDVIISKNKIIVLRIGYRKNIYDN